MTAKINTRKFCSILQSAANKPVFWIEIRKPDHSLLCEIQTSGGADENEALAEIMVDALNAALESPYKARLSEVAVLKARAAIAKAENPENA